MRKEDIYDQWKRARREPSETAPISNQIMARIHEYERSKERASSFRYVTELPFTLSRLTRYAAALGLSALGIYRLFSITGNLLMP